MMIIPNMKILLFKKVKKVIHLQAFKKGPRNPKTSEKVTTVADYEIINIAVDESHKVALIVKDIIIVDGCS